MLKNDLGSGPLGLAHLTTDQSILGIAYLLGAGVGLSVAGPIAPLIAALLAYNDLHWINAGCPTPQPLFPPTPPPSPALPPVAQSETPGTYQTPSDDDDDDDDDGSGITAPLDPSPQTPPPSPATATPSLYRGDRRQPTPTPTPTPTITVTPTTHVHNHIPGAGQMVSSPRTTPPAIAQSERRTEPPDLGLYPDPRERMQVLLKAMAESGFPLGRLLKHPFVWCYGRSQSGKTTIAMLLSAARIAMGNKIAYLSTDEDVEPLGWSELHLGPQSYSEALEDITETINTATKGGLAGQGWVIDELLAAAGQYQINLTPILTSVLMKGSKTKGLTIGISQADTSSAHGLKGVDAAWREERVSVQAIHSEDSLGERSPSGRYLVTQGDQSEEWTVPEWMLTKLNRYGVPCPVVWLLHHFPEMSQQFRSAPPSTPPSAPPAVPSAAPTDPSLPESLGMAIAIDDSKSEQSTVNVFSEWDDKPTHKAILIYLSTNGPKSIQSIKDRLRNDRTEAKATGTQVDEAISTLVESQVLLRQDELVCLNIR